MTKTNCFYAQSTCHPKRTREHVISASVLKSVFGDPIQNVIRAELFGNKALIDHEPLVRDVCQACNNNALSPYDLAGVALIKQLQGVDPTGLRINTSREALNWILKTHLNYFRIIKDRETRDVYPVSQLIKDALIQGSGLPHDKFQLLIEGWVGEPYFWDAEDARKISWFNYRSIRFRDQRVVLSDFRMKTLTTWLIIPSDDQYDGFARRAASALEETYRDFNFRPLQLVDTAKAIEFGFVDLQNVLPLAEVKKFIVPPPSQ